MFRPFLLKRTWDHGTSSRRVIASESGRLSFPLLSTSIICCHHEPGLSRHCVRRIKVAGKQGNVSLTALIEAPLRRSSETNIWGGPYHHSCLDSSSARRTKGGHYL